MACCGAVLRLLLPSLLFAPGCAPAPRGTEAPPVVEPPPVTNARTEESAPPAPEPPRYEPREADRITPHQPLEQPEALASFYDALAGIDGASDPGIVRVVHLGASMIGYDDLTGVLRERFQTRFGDGGAGLVMLQRYMYNYKHLWVELHGSGWEDCFIRVRCRGDGHYGLGGVTFETDGGARTRIRTREHDLGD